MLSANNARSSKAAEPYRERRLIRSPSDRAIAVGERTSLRVSDECPMNVLESRRLVSWALRALDAERLTDLG
jgi:hypothetical protein